jgi:hypothetical protein
MMVGCGERMLRMLLIAQRRLQVLRGSRFKASQGMIFHRMRVPSPTSVTALPLRLRKLDWTAP